MQKSYALAIPPLDTLISAAETMISDETSSMIKEDKTKSNYDANILSTLILEEAVKKMADALELWLKEDGDLSKVMQQFNTKPAKAKKRAEKEAAEKEVKVSKTE